MLVPSFRRSVVFIAASSLVMTTFAFAGPAPTPTTLPDTSGEGIIKHFVEVSGGADAYAKVKSRVTSGTFAIPAQGVAGEISIFQKAPNLTRVTGSIGGVTFDRGFDGQVAFEVNSMTGTRLIEGAEREAMEFQALNAATRNLGEALNGIENLGVDQLDGHDDYRLELTTKSGGKIYQWYNVETGLLDQSQMSLDSPMGKLDVLIGFSDWKESGGVKVPGKMKQVIQPIGIEQNFEFTKIEADVDIPDDKFALPDEVKELVKANGATTQPAGGK